MKITRKTKVKGDLVYKYISTVIQMCEKSFYNLVFHGFSCEKWRVYPALNGGNLQHRKLATLFIDLSGCLSEQPFIFVLVWN